MWGYSMLGGALMLAIGVLYLIFEEKLLSKSKIAEDSTAPADNTLSRALIGIQVS
jgi:phosphatidylinositol glycan class N